VLNIFIVSLQYVDVVQGIKIEIKSGIFIGG